MIPLSVQFGAASNKYKSGGGLITGACLCGVGVSGSVRGGGTRLGGRGGAGAVGSRGPVDAVSEEPVEAAD